MMNSTLTICALLCLSFASTPSTAWAEDVPQFGKVVIKLSPAYAKFTVDGKKWGNHYFYEEGKELVVERVNRSKPVLIVVTSDGYKSRTLTIATKKWRKTRVKKTRTYEYLYKATVTLVKMPPAPKKKTKK